MTTYVNGSARFTNGATTDTAARNYLADFHTTITSSGWVVTSDTGQMDESTVVYGLQNNTWGYRMYKLNDSLVNTYPIYMKIIHGTGSSFTYVAPTVYFGTATNGAGSFIGTTISFGLNAASAADTQMVANAMAIGSYGEGYSFIAPGRNVYTNSSWNKNIFIGVSRQFDASGNLMSNGNFTAICNSLGSTNYLKATSYVKAWDTTYSVVGNSISLCPHDISNPGSSVEFNRIYTRYGPPSVVPGVASYTLNDIAVDAEMSFAAVGSTPRNYRALPNFGYGHPTPISRCLAIIWE